MLETVPVIDVGPYLQGRDTDLQVAAAVRRACEDIGFFAITGHGIDGPSIAHTVASAKAFFALPADEKARARPATPDAPRGFRAIGDEGLAYSRGVAAPADLKEVFHVGPEFDERVPYYQAPDARPHFIANVWPSRPATFRPAVQRYYVLMEQLAGKLMEIFALALDLPCDWFASRIDRHISALRILSYPEQTADPIPGQLRAGAHSDYGTLTILYSENVAAGLQVRNKKGVWVDVRAPEGSFVINIGDLMMRWTNDRWISTLHRVANPPRDRAGTDRRLSIAFFHHPNYDAEVRCIETCLRTGEQPKYPPVNAGPYRLEKYTATRIKA